MAASLKNTPDFAKAAKAANVEPKTTELITREAPLPELGVAPEVMEAVFKLPQGAVSDVLTTGASVLAVMLQMGTAPPPPQFTLIVTGSAGACAFAA